MISEQDKKAILNGALARTNNNKKAQFMFKSDHPANVSHPYLFVISDKGKCYTDWYNDHLNSKQDKFNSSIIELWQDKPEPFDLEKALAGEPLIDLHNNEKCWLYKSHKNGDLITEYENTYSHLENIEPLEYLQNGLDLSECFGMWKEPQPEPKTVTLTLPCPLKELKDEMWFIGADGVVFKSDFQKGNPLRTCNMNKFNAGFYFGSEEDAQAWLDALKNNRR